MMKQTSRDQRRIVRTAAALAFLFAPVFAPAEPARAGSCRPPGADAFPTAACEPPAPVSTAPGSLVVAQAGGVPTLEFAKGCRDTAAGNTKTLDDCMRAEQTARLLYPKLPSNTLIPK